MRPKLGTLVCRCVIHYEVARCLTGISSSKKSAYAARERRMQLGKADLFRVHMIGSPFHMFLLSYVCVNPYRLPATVTPSEDTYYIEDGVRG